MIKIPTCEQCGYKESGRYFKGKHCPECNESQFPSILTSSKPKKKEPEIFTSEPMILDNTEKEISKVNGILGSSPYEEIEEFEDEPESYGLPSLEKLESIEVDEDLGKVTLSVSEWKILTVEIYQTVESMLKEMNPKFYNSETAKNLRTLNAKLSAIVLSAKAVNPLRILLFTNFLYVLPALRGLGKRKKEKSEEVIVESKPKKSKDKDENPNKNYYGNE